MELLWQDIRYGARMLLKDRSVTLIAVITLALGIGANTAIFTVVHAVLLRPLPYADPDRLVHLWETRPRVGFDQMEASRPNFLDWKARNQLLEDLAGYNRGGGFVRLADTQERILAGRGTANFFDLLGVKPILGRAFRPEEEQPGSPRVMLLTYGFWQRRFGADPKIIGQTLNVSGTPFEIIGVLPADFQFALVGSPDYWTTIIPMDFQVQRRNLHWLNTIARLKPGVTLAQARAEMRGIAAQLESEYPEANARASVRIFPLSDEITGPTRPALFVLPGAVALVLLIACVNVANLLLARVAAREKEMAVRTALGAARRRLVRQLLVESVLLALLGGAAGLVVALWSVDTLVSAFPEAILRSMPYLTNVRVHFGVLGFNFAVAALMGVLFGLAPALHGTKLSLHGSLKEGVRASAGHGHTRLRNSLVVSEVALALALLVAMGLTLRSLVRVLHRDPGFRLERLLAMNILLPDQKYDTTQKAARFWEELSVRVTSLPGVEAAGTTSILPLTGGGNTTLLLVAFVSCWLPARRATRIDPIVALRYE